MTFGSKIMSAEGDNNLDNDTAGDLICVASEALFDRVLLLMRHPNGHEYDDQEIGELFFLIEVAFALHDKHLIGPSDAMPGIQEEVPSFIERWEGYHRTAGHEPPATRKNSMVETFDRLDALIREFDLHQSGDADKSAGDVDSSELDLLSKTFEYSDSQGNPK